MLKNLFAILLMLAAFETGAAPIIVQAEDETQVSRTGSWSQFFGSVLNDGSGLESSLVGSTLSLTFTTGGGDFSIFGTTGPNRGMFDVAISGLGSSLVDSFSPSFLFQQEYFSINLAPGTYSVTTTVSTPIHAIDYFQFEESAAVPEISIMALFATGLLGLGFARRRSVRS